MINIKKEIEELSSEQVELLEQLLIEEGIEISRLPIFVRRESSNLFPVSFAQHRLWFLCQLEPENPLYNIPVVLGLEGELDLEKLEYVLSEIVSRHEILRTTFEIADDQPVQVVSPPRPLKLKLIDLSGLAEQERTARTRELADENARRPFDLSRGPLFRLTLLRLSERQHVLLMAMHHIIFDGWSSGILLKELVTLYRADLSGGAALLEQLPIQYADFALWQRKWLQGDTLERQIAYWKRQLEGAPSILELPTDRPRPTVQTFRGSHESLTIPSSLRKSLHEMSRREGGTLFMTLLMAFNAQLCRYTGQEDIVVGTSIAGRNRAEIEGLIGFFVNMLALRTDLTGNPTFRELLRRVREMTLGAFANQDVPFDKLVEELRPERSMSHTPIYQVIFVLQNVPVPDLDIEGLKLLPLGGDNQTTPADLTLVMAEVNEELIATLKYNTDIFEAATIRAMLKNYKVMLEEMAAHPNWKLMDIPLDYESRKPSAYSATTPYKEDQFIFELNE